MRRFSSNEKKQGDITAGTEHFRFLGRGNWGCKSNGQATSAEVLNSPSKLSRAHWMVCSIALGKFFRVQMGMDFSGGSRDEPYDSVLKGDTTCSECSTAVGKQLVVRGFRCTLFTDKSSVSGKTDAVYPSGQRGIW